MYRRPSLSFLVLIGTKFPTVLFRICARKSSCTLFCENLFYYSSMIFIQEELSHRKRIQFIFFIVRFEKQRYSRMRMATPLGRTSKTDLKNPHKESQMDQGYLLSKLNCLFTRPNYSMNT